MENYKNRKEKGTENSYEKEEKIIPNRKSCDCINCDANQKWIF